MEEDQLLLLSSVAAVAGKEEHEKAEIPALVTDPYTFLKCSFLRVAQ